MSEAVKSKKIINYKYIGKKLRELEKKRPGTRIINVTSDISDKPEKPFRPETYNYDDEKTLALKYIGDSIVYLADVLKIMINESK